MKTKLFWMLFFYTGLTVVWVLLIIQFKVFSPLSAIITLFQVLFFVNIYNGIMKEKQTTEESNDIPKDTKTKP